MSGYPTNKKKRKYELPVDNGRDLVLRFHGHPRFVARCFRVQLLCCSTFYIEPTTLPSLPPSVQAFLQCDQRALCSLPFVVSMLDTRSFGHVTVDECPG